MNEKQQTEKDLLWNSFLKKIENLVKQELKRKIIEDNIKNDNFEDFFEEYKFLETEYKNLNDWIFNNAPNTSKIISREKENTNNNNETREKLEQLTKIHHQNKQLNKKIINRIKTLKLYKQTFWEKFVNILRTFFTVLFNPKKFKLQKEQKNINIKENKVNPKNEWDEKKNIINKKTETTAPTIKERKVLTC